MRTRKAVFLDRDGTINREVDNLTSIKQLKLLPNVAKAIRRSNDNNFLVIVITNQPVVARGWLTEEDLAIIHKQLLKRLLKQNAKIDAIYYCPHHPEANLRKYKMSCADRKPNIGLIKKAAADFAISLPDSFFVGDSTTDMQTALNAGIRGILVKTGYGGKDQKFAVNPTYTANNLFDAVSFILDQTDK